MVSKNFQNYFQVSFYQFASTISDDLKKLINFFNCIVETEEDYDAFCLAYMFTYRDFEMGTLGLAWTGDLKNAGGVCEKNGVCILNESTFQKCTNSNDFQFD